MLLDIKCLISSRGRKIQGYRATPLNSMHQKTNDKKRIVDQVDGSIYAFSKGSNNLMEYFYFKGQMIDYKEVIRVEETSSEEYGILTAQGYNNFYKIYKVNEFGVESCICTLATRVA